MNGRKAPHVRLRIHKATVHIAVNAATALMFVTSVIAAEPRAVSLEYASQRGSDGGAAHAGELVTVRGIATVGPKAFTARYALLYIQDDYAGLAIFTRDTSPAHLPQIRPGDIVETTGQISFHNGTVQVIPERIEVVGRDKVPRPLQIRAADLQNFRVAGRLVQIEGTIGDLVSRGGIFMTLSAENRAVVAAYITESQREKFEALRLKRGDLVSITGIASQHDIEAPYMSGWQIRPRTAADVVVLPPPLMNQRMVAAGALLLALIVVLSLLWGLVLRRRVRLATESLRQTVAVLKAQQQATPDGMLVLDGDENVRQFNDRFVEMWGLQGDVLTGSSFSDVLKHQLSSAADAAAYAALAAGDQRDDPHSSVFSADMVLTSGRIINAVRTPLPATATGLPNAGWLWSYRDITERELLRDQVERSARVAGLGRLAAGLAHEFNNVLMSIGPHAEILRRRHPAAAEAATKILSAVERGKKTTGEVLRLTRPVEITKKTISVATLMEAIESELRVTLDPGIEVRVRPPASPANVSVDPAQFSQVFINLALNAQQAMLSSGRIRIACEIVRGGTPGFRSLVKASDQAHFTFEDDGPGIPREVIDHVFEPLFTTRKRSGSGLGLAIAQRIVEAHGGTIFVESDPGRLTTFHLLLPASPAATDEVDVQTVPASEPAVNGRRILLVEDDAAVADALTVLLTAAGAQVQRVERGEDAVDAVMTAIPDVVLLDVDLPGIPGDEVYRQLRARWPFLPVIFTSGHCDSSDLREALGSDVAFLPKPYESATLYEEVAKACAAARMAGDMAGGRSPRESSLPRF